MFSWMRLRSFIALQNSPVIGVCPRNRFSKRSSLWLPLLVAIALVSGCAITGDLANAPRVSLADLRLAEVGLLEQRYVAWLRIQNPNDTDLNVRGMEYTIYLNGRKFADGVSDRDFSVPGYGEEIVEVNLTSTALRVLDQFRSLSEGESQVLRYRIAGSLSLEGLRRSVAFSHQDEIDLSPGAGG